MSKQVWSLHINNIENSLLSQEQITLLETLCNRHHITIVSSMISPFLIGCNNECDLDNLLIDATIQGCFINAVKCIES